MGGSDSYYQRFMVGQGVAADGTQPYGRATRTFEQAVSQVHGQHYEQNKRGNIFMAQAIVTAPVIWTTEAGTGGPLLWNGSTAVDLVVLAVGYGVTTESTVEASFGITGGYGQTAAPTTTTAIDSQGAMDCTSATPQASVFRVGTTGTNRWYIPLGYVTNLIGNTAREAQQFYIPLNGMIVVKPQGFVSMMAASATLTTAVVNSFIIWEEVPV